MKRTLDAKNEQIGYVLFNQSINQLTDRQLRQPGRTEKQVKTVGKDKQHTTDSLLTF